MRPVKPRAASTWRKHAPEPARRLPRCARPRPQTTTVIVAGARPALRLADRTVVERSSPSTRQPESQARESICRIARAIDSSGRMSPTACSLIGSFNMPNTTQVAAFCASVRALPSRVGQFPPPAPRSRVGENAPRPQQLAQRVLEKLLQPQSRLGHHGHGARKKGVQRRAVLFRQGRTDDGGDRRLGLDLAQESQTVHARHRDVEQQHVEPDLANHRAGAQGVGRAARQLDLGVALQQVH